jgi:hypothetical protein
LRWSIRTYVDHAASAFESASRTTFTTTPTVPEKNERTRGVHAPRGASAGIDADGAVDALTLTPLRVARESVGAFRR